MALIAELKRRNVIRVALLYCVASWLVLQVADVLFGVMGVPDWSLRLVFGILLLGLPIALVSRHVALASRRPSRGGGLVRGGAG